MKKSRLIIILLLLAVMIAAVLVMYSRSVPTRYTVTYNSAGGFTAPAPLTVDNGTVIMLPADPGRPGFIFKGWSEYPSDVPAKGAYTVAKDTSFTAVWEAEPVPVAEAPPVLSDEPSADNITAADAAGQAPVPVKPAPRPALKPMIKPKPAPKAPTDDAGLHVEDTGGGVSVAPLTPPVADEPDEPVVTGPVLLYQGDEGDNATSREGFAPRRWLTGISGGALFNSSEFDGQDFGSYMSFFADITAQYFITDYFGAGVNILYRQGSSGKLSDFLGTGEDATFSSNTVALGFLATGRYPGETFEPYISGGITFNFNNIEIKTPGNKYYSGTGSCAGFIADLGLRVYPGERFFIGIAGRYMYNNQDGVDLGGPGAYLTMGITFN